MPVPYTFGSATSSIPLSQLDSNFSTPVTIGNTTVALGNTVTSVGNLTLTNTTISSGTATVSNVVVTGATVPPNGMYLPAANSVGISSAGVNAVYVDSSQNVGIGTTSPSAFGGTNLQVQNLSIASILWSNGTITGQLLCSSGAEVTVGSRSNHPLRFGTNDTERARIDTSGNLLVGQTSQTASEKFGVTQSSATAQSARFYASSTSYTNDVVQISCARSGATTEYNALTVFDNNTTLKMLIRANGNLLNANNSYGSLSDQRLKENIVDATPKLEKLNQVRIVNFNMIGDEQKQIGVIAQEVEKIFPSIVEETQDKDVDGNLLDTTTKSVKYSVFVPMLIKAMQEQQAMIEELKSKVAALEAK